MLSAMLILIAAVNITSQITMSVPHYSDSDAAFPVTFDVTFSGFAEGENFLVLNLLKPVNSVATDAATSFAYNSFMSELSLVYARGGFQGSGIQILGPKVTSSMYYQRNDLKCWFDKALPNRALAHNAT